MATVSILVVDSQPCREPFRGVIRVQDIRATEKDKVQINKSFRPGDVVLAQVISLGDARSYYLSTARNELGVVFAESEAGMFSCTALVEPRLFRPTILLCRRDHDPNFMARDGLSQDQAKRV